MKNKFYKVIKNTLQLDYWLIFVIPVSALIGIFIQISMLSNYNAVALFSWSQIFSDCAKVLPLLSSTLFGYFAFTFFKNLKPNKKDIVVSFIILFVLMITFWGIIYLIMKSNMYFGGIIFFFILGYTSSFINSFVTQPSKITAEKIGIFFIPGAALGVVFFFSLAVFLILVPLINYTTREIKIELNGKIYDINYMNDKYIIYDNGKILKNNDQVNIKIKQHP